MHSFKNKQFYCRYSIEERGAEKNPIFMQMNIYFDQTVEVTAAQKTVDTLTLLTRLGGATGVGKEGIWCVLLFLDLLIFIIKFGSQ